MALSIVWSNEAIDDILAIAEFIGKDSPFYARMVTQKIMSIAESASQFPQAGRKVPELNNPQIREKFVYSYRIIYEVKTSVIEILAVVHGKRLLDLT